MRIANLPPHLLDAMAAEAVKVATSRFEQGRLLPKDWEQVARPKQLPPKGDWTIWMLMAGRGFGKTRSGAEQVNRWVDEGVKRIAIVGQSAGDVRDVMIEGASGLLAVAPPWNRPHYEPSKRRVTWPNGARATTFSAEKPDQLRGPEFEKAWGDEVAAWRFSETHDNLMLALRAGKHPQAIYTTTPKPVRVVRELVARDGQDVIVVRGSTYENLDNLAPTFKAEILRRYEGTRIGRQELFAELLDEAPDALWKRGNLDETRVSTHPALVKAIIAIDPAVTAKGTSDETGLIVAGLGEDGQGYVLNDLSGRHSPNDWARIVVEAYETWELDAAVAEVNNGGDLVKTNIKSYRDADDRPRGQNVPVHEVRATRGKLTRAEPIAALYEQKRVHHVGVFGDLEDQLCNWTPGEKSPDRLDALVWALTKLMLKSTWLLGSSDTYEDEA